MGYVSKFNGNEIDVAVAKVLSSSEAAIAGCVKLDSSFENPVNLDTKILPGYYTVDYYESTVEAPIDVQPLIFYVQKQPVSNRLIQIINNGPITYTRAAYNEDFSDIDWNLEPNFGFIALVGGSLPDPNDTQYPEWGIIALVTDHGDKPVLYIKLAVSENPIQYMWVDYLGIGKIEGIVTLDSAGLVPVSQIPVLDYDPLGSASVVASNLANFIALKGSANGLAELDANQKVPVSQIPSLNYDTKGSALAVDNKLTTLKNSIGVPNGIAELGEDGKVPAGQLPSLNYDPVGSSAVVDQKLTTFMNTKGAAHGLAELDDDGKVPSSQLPSYVDDVLEYDTKELFPTTAESGKIYVDLSTNLAWRWSGSTYVAIASSLAIGVTPSTAFRGDHGKIAYDHSQVTSGNPHNTTVADIGAVSIMDIGVNNGIASLGDDGKVPKAQLPKINAEQVVKQAEEPTQEHTVLWIDTSEEAEELNLDNRYAAKVHEHNYAAPSHAHTWESINSRPDSFIPSAHVTSHLPGGSDELRPIDIGAISITDRNYFDLSKQLALFTGDILTYADAQENSISFIVAPEVTNLPYATYWLCEIKFFDNSKTYIRIDVTDILNPQYRYWRVRNGGFVWSGWTTATSGKNLFTNAWFAAPYLVNQCQRGISAWTGGPGPDRWYRQTVTAGDNAITNGYIAVSGTNNDGIFTRLEESELEVGKTYTSSLLLSDGTILTAKFVCPAKDGTVGGAVYVPDWRVAILYVGAAWNVYAAITYLNTPQTLNIVAAKLELGHVSTLHLDSPPSPTEQVLNRQACRKYLQVIPAGTVLTGIAATNKEIYYTIPYWTEMRAIPTISIASFVGTIIASTYLYTAASITESLSVSSNNTCIIAKINQTFSSYMSATLQFDNPIILSAEF